MCEKSIPIIAWYICASLMFTYTCFLLYCLICKCFEICWNYVAKLKTDHSDQQTVLTIIKSLTWQSHEMGVWTLYNDNSLQMWHALQIIIFGRAVVCPCTFSAVCCWAFLGPTLLFQYLNIFLGVLWWYPYISFLTKQAVEVLWTSHSLPSIKLIPIENFSCTSDTDFIVSLYYNILQPMGLTLQVLL